MAENEHKYYMPRDDRGLLEWAENFLTVAERNAAAWHLTAAKLADLRVKTTAYKAKLEKCETPESNSVTVAEKNQAKTALEHDFQTYVNQEIRYNDNIDDAGRVDLRAPRKDKIRTPQGAPHQRPVIEIELSKTREHILRWHVDEDESRALPYNCNGWVLVRKVLESVDTVPADPEEMGHSELVTRNPYTVEHKPGDEGKRCAYAGAFQNKKGERGPWCDVVAAVIP